MEISPGPLNRMPFQESINSLVHPDGHYRGSIILNYAPRGQAAGEGRRSLKEGRA